jgi:hypothetical protein
VLLKEIICSRLLVLLLTPGDKPFLTRFPDRNNITPPREGEGSGDPSGLQKRSRRKSAPVDSPLLDGIRLVFLAVTYLDGFITFRLD